MRKKMILGILVIIIMLSGLGCAGKRHSILKTDGSVEHSGQNISIFDPDAGPVELATAYAIKKRADIESEALTRYKEGKVLRSTSKYCFVATNLTNKPAKVYHPELGSDFDLPANNGYAFLELSYIPEKIIFKNAEGKIIWQPMPETSKLKNKKVFMGCEVDLKFNLTRQ